MYGELPTFKSTDGNSEVAGFPVQIINPPKTALLKLPTSQQVLDRLTKSVVIQTDLGRGKSKSHSVPARNLDVQLFEALTITVNGGDFDEFEAEKAINNILYCRVLDLEREGTKFKVTLDTPLGPTVHTLDSPMEKDMAPYRESIVIDKSLGRGKREMKYNYPAAARLYDSCHPETEGYATGTEIPIHHKFAVVSEVASTVDEVTSPVDPN